MAKKKQTAPATQEDWLREQIAVLEANEGSHEEGQAVGAKLTHGELQRLEQYRHDLRALTDA